MSWEIYGTDEFFEWFASLAEEGMEEVDYKVRLLEEFGPNLNRPHWVWGWKFGHILKRVCQAWQKVKFY
jgi:hypothetical protein